MIIRIVKMQFAADKVDEFISVFEESKEKIRGFDGNNHLKLLQDKHDPTIFFTYSYWDSLEALNRYRHSDLFKAVWAKTKINFVAKPEAWSTEALHVLD